MTPRNPDAKRWSRIQKGAAIAASLCIVLWGLVGCEPSVKTVARITDQAELARIALNAKDWHVRRAAVKNLTDQSLLAKIALHNDESGVRAAAWEKLTDQAELAKIAREAKVFYCRQTALEKLTDQAVLGKFAVEDKDDYIRRAAVERLTDQALLAKIAVEDKELKVRQAALETLTDQAVLGKFAVEDEDDLVGPAAAKKLTDQAVLAMVAVDAKDYFVRKAAVEKLTNHALLAKVAFKANQRETRIEAFLKIDDAKTPAELSATAEDPAARQCGSVLLNIRSACQEIPVEHRNRLCGDVLGIVGALMDPLVTKELGDIKDIKTEWESLEKPYIGKMSNIAFTIKGEVFTVSVKLSNGFINHTWSTSFPGETGVKYFIPATIDPEDDFFGKILDFLSVSAVAEVALKSEMTALRCAAVKKLTDQALLSKIILEDKDSHVRESAENRQTDLRECP
jgi:hypothetical protein